MSTSRILLAVVALTLILVGFQFLQRNEDPGPATPDPVPLDRSFEERQESPEVQSAEPVVLKAEDQPDCLTFKQIQELPELYADVERMESVAASGRALQAYIGLDDDTLRNFAEQGDSAAMLIIGANAVMRAYGLDQSLAISWLDHELQIEDLDFGTQQLSSNSSLELNDAAFWFYEAAIHGRLLALQNYGAVRGRLFGGAVGLGWVSAEEYDVLTSNEKTSLVPSNLYAQVAFDIAPALRDGALGALSRIGPESDLQRAIRNDAVAEFEQTLSDSGLPPVEIEPAVSPEIDALFERVCESERQEMMRRRGLE